MKYSGMTRKEAVFAIAVENFGRPKTIPPGQVGNHVDEEKAFDVAKHRH